MRTNALSRRYAGALFETARKAKVIDPVESDLGLLTYSLEATPTLREALNHPLIPPDRKKSMVRELFAESVQDITLDFLGLLVDKKREAILEDVESEYLKIANEYRNIVSVRVTSAVELTPEECKVLRSKLEQFTGKNVDLQVQQDRGLIGGLIVRIGDTILDGSVAGNLIALRNQLLSKE